MDSSALFNSESWTDTRGCVHWTWTARGMEDRQKRASKQCKYRRGRSDCVRSLQRGGAIKTREKCMESGKGKLASQPSQMGRWGWIGRRRNFQAYSEDW